VNIFYRIDDLETKLKHVEHMQGLWRNTGAYYRQLKKNPPANVKDLCGCINTYMNEDITTKQKEFSSNLRSYGINCKSASLRLMRILSSDFE
jgi:hypothetical protein